MATSIPSRDRRAEAREILRASQQRNAELRESVLRHAAELGRIAERLRAGHRA